MYRKTVFILFVLLFSIMALASNFSKLPGPIQKSLHKYYKSQKITVVSVKRKSGKYTIIIQYDSGKDKVIVTKKGKILSISDYLGDMQPSGGC